MKLGVIFSGVFGRTYAMMLVAILAAEAIIFTMLINEKGPPPPVIPFEVIVEGLRDESSGAGEFSTFRLARRISGARESSAPTAEESALTTALSRALGAPADDIGAKVAMLGPPRVFGLQTVEAVAKGADPYFVAGEFLVERSLGDGRWVQLSTDGRFERAVTSRIALVLLGTLAAVAPFAYLLARRIAEPVKRFADAAERLGKDPRAAPMRVEGPREMQLASVSFNTMRERILRNMEERTTMFAAVAHDLRSPLMRLAFKTEELDPAHRSYFLRQIHEMRAMLDGILDFLKVEFEDRARGPISLASVVEAACADASEAGGTVRFSGSENDAVVLDDPAALRSLFGNLINNAITYGGGAEVDIRCTEQMVSVRIADRGPGIPPSELEKVFSPFYRLEASRNRATGGSGLGLALVRLIAAAHGGRVSLANRDGGGLLATAQFPLQSKPAA
jgi:signal transduction histidine kinase